MSGPGPRPQASPAPASAPAPSSGVASRRPVGLSFSDTVANIGIAIRTKPFLSTAFILCCLSYFFLLISTWSPWYVVKGASIFKVKTTTSLFLLSSSSCSVTDGGRKDTVPGSYCIVTPLADIPKDYDYLREAGGTAFAFVFLNLLLGIPGIHATKLRHTDTGTVTMSCLGWMHSKGAAPALNGVMALFSLLALAVFAGVVSGELDDTTIKTITGVAIIDSAAFDAGFAFVVLAFLFNVAATLLVWLFHEEQARVPNYYVPDPGEPTEGPEHTSGPASTSVHSNPLHTVPPRP